MTPEAQNIALAEACGVYVCSGCFNLIDPSVCSCGGAIDHYPDGHNPVPMGCTCGYSDAPQRKSVEPCCEDFFADLNAQFEAWQKLTEEQKLMFGDSVERISLRDGIRKEEARARFGCECLLRALGRWIG